MRRIVWCWMKRNKSEKPGYGRDIMEVAGELDDRWLALSQPQGGRRVGGRKVRTPVCVSRAAFAAAPDSD